MLPGVEQTLETIIQKECVEISTEKHIQAKNIFWQLVRWFLSDYPYSILPVDFLLQAKKLTVNQVETIYQNPSQVHRC